MLLKLMEVHYSQPRGFVGRTIADAIYVGGVFYGCIVAGSATRFLPGRDGDLPLNQIINNVFFHVRKVGGKYPCRNFTERVLIEWECRIQDAWERKYGDIPRMLESLVELPRTGECYRRAGWIEVGMTKGYTCKRVAGKGSDSWTGRRVWNTTDLRPKRVFTKSLSRS